MKATNPEYTIIIIHYESVLRKRLLSCDIKPHVVIGGKEVPVEVIQVEHAGDRLLLVEYRTL